MTVRSVETSSLISDVNVEVVAIDPDGEPEWLSPALSFPPNPTSCVGNAPRPPKRAFRGPGQYLLEVRVTDSDGVFMTRFMVEIGNARRRGALLGGAVLAGALGGAIGIGTWVALQSKRARRWRDAISASASSGESVGEGESSESQSGPRAR